MLVLSFDLHDGGVIDFKGELVEFEVLRLGKDRVRIGFKADKSIAIDRAEVRARKRADAEREKEAAP